MNTLKTMIAVASMALTVPMAAPAAAQEFPLKAGDYTNVSAIFIKDGSEFRYAQHLADIWVANQEFAKEQGWITDYKMYVVQNRRDGEPTLYLTVTFPSIPDAAESERRAAAYRELANKTEQQLAAESGDRAEYRTLLGSMLLQEYTVRK